MSRQTRLLSGVFVLFGLFSMPICSSARADILFLDFNSATDEIAAAQKAATARGEKLVLVPKRTPEQQKVYNEIHQMDFQQEALTVKVVSLNTQAAQTKNPEKVSQLQSQIDSLTREMKEQATKEETLRNSVPKVNFSMDDVDSILKSYSDTHKKFETIVISGHHGGTTYFGMFGFMQHNELAAEFSKYPDLQGAVHSLYGWGCYSATPSQALDWEEAFPNVQVVGGFDGSAPGSGRSAGSDFLTGLLTREGQIMNASKNEKSVTNFDAVVKTIQALPGFDLTNAGTCTRAECVGINTKHISLSNLSEGCGQEVLERVELADTSTTGLMANPYHTMYGGPPAQDVPCNTQSSSLRTAYNLLRRYEHCGSEDTPLKESFRSVTKNADRMMRTIFLNQVFKNFQLAYAQEIKTVQKSCTSFPDLSSPLACVPDENSPHEIHRTDLTAATATLAITKASCQFSDADAPASHRLAQALSYVITSDPTCIPAAWVEPATDASQLAPIPSSCFTQLGAPL